MPHDYTSSNNLDYDRYKTIARHSPTPMQREVHKYKLPIKERKLGKLELESNQHRDWSLVTTITITKH